MIEMHVVCCCCCSGKLTISVFGISWPANQNEKVQSFWESDNETRFSGARGQPTKAFFWRAWAGLNAFRALGRCGKKPLRRNALGSKLLRSTLRFLYYFYKGELLYTLWGMVRTPRNLKS